MTRLLATCAVIALSVGVSGAAHATVYPSFNGGFGSAGDFSDSQWTATDTGDGLGTTFYAEDPTQSGDGINGSAAAVFGTPPGSTQPYAISTLTQSYTAPVAAGQQYTVNFYLSNLGQGCPTGPGSCTDADIHFAFYFDGTMLFNDTTTTSYDNTLNSYTVTADGSGNDTIMFEGYNAQSYWYLSGVTVATIAPIPAPAALGVFLVGMAGLGAARRRRAAA